jgi:hypothetical protein
MAKPSYRKDNKLEFMSPRHVAINKAIIKISVPLTNALNNNYTTDTSAIIPLFCLDLHTPNAQTLLRYMNCCRRCRISLKILLDKIYCSFGNPFTETVSFSYKIKMCLS